MKPWERCASLKATERNAVSSFLVTTTASGVAIFAGRAIVAVALGAMIGLERQWRQRMAGLRTNALVALGAALFELLAVQMTGVQGVDPIRIAAYVVSGIGFLGAGVILRDGVSVRGINTAATIWCSAAVGVLAGAGYIIQAIIGALLVVTAHLALRPVARRIDKLPARGDTEVETLYRFRATCRSADEAHIRALAVQALTRDDFVLRAVRSDEVACYLPGGGVGQEVDRDQQQAARRPVGGQVRVVLPPVENRLDGEAVVVADGDQRPGHR
jgi:putative Mg2+ transporter-C (MgtC) family protein